ncbi:hypothetical protein [Coralliovum pocilloporae]|uniref:hypothetical protein n=1 Tax=Coralliovum pocilloporae TaxID=3066369 RepID=UPI0033079DC2
MSLARRHIRCLHDTDMVTKALLAARLRPDPRAGLTLPNHPETGQGAGTPLQNELNGPRP